MRAVLRRTAGWHNRVVSSVGPIVIDHTQCFVLVNGNLGFVTRRPDGRLFSVVGFTIASGKIVEIDILADPERLSRLDLSAIAS